MGAFGPAKLPELRFPESPNDTDHLEINKMGAIAPASNSQLQVQDSYPKLFKLLASRSTDPSDLRTSRLPGYELLFGMLHAVRGSVRFA